MLADRQGGEDALGRVIGSGRNGRQAERGRGDAGEGLGGDRARQGDNQSDDDGGERARDYRHAEDRSRIGKFGKRAR